jgi:hypothetical protein
MSAGRGGTHIGAQQEQRLHRFATFAVLVVGSSIALLRGAELPLNKLAFVQGVNRATVLLEV